MRILKLISRSLLASSGLGFEVIAIDTVAYQSSLFKGVGRYVTHWSPLLVLEFYDVQSENLVG